MGPDVDDRATADPTRWQASAAGEMERVRASARRALFGNKPMLIGDRYDLGNLIGEGGLGSVYVAFDSRLRRDVAIKFVRPRVRDGADPQRLFREALVLARLSHPNIVPVFDVGRADHDVYIAMELIDGLSLEQWIKAAPRSWRECLPLFDQLALALDAAHRAGLVHGDVKPQNAMIDREGRLFVLDFGLAREAETAATEPEGDERPGHTVTRIGGTRGFMPPEQYAHAPEQRSDQFAFCVSLFRALYGRPPFDAKDDGIDIAALRTQPAERSASSPKQGVASVPRWLRAAVLRGLAPNPADRWASMAELRSKLQPPRRRVWPFAALGIAALGVGAWAVQREPEACAFEDDALDGVWSDDLATEISERAPPTFDAAAMASSITNYGDSWSSLRASSCAAHAEGKITDALYELRLACLRTSRSQLAYLTSQVQDPGFTEWSALGVTLAALSVPRCDDDSSLLAGRPTTGIDWEVSHEIDRGLAEAKVELMLGRPREYLDRLLALEQEVYGKANEPAIESLLVNTIGAALNAKGRFAEAEKRLRPAMLAARRFGYWPEAEALLLGTLAEAVAQQPARESEALLLAEQAVATAESNEKGRTHRAQVLRSLGIAQLRARRYDEALASFDAALAAPDPPMMAELGERELAVFRAGGLNLRGLALEAMGRNGEAEQAWRDALVLLGGGEIASLEHAQVMNNLGVLLRTEKRHPEAIALLERSAAMKQQLGERHQAAATLMNVGNVHLAAEQASAAVEVYDRALDLLAADPEPATEGLLRMNRALAFRDLHEPTAELEEWTRALALVDAADAGRRHAILFRRGRLLTELEQCPRAREDLEAAIAVEHDRTGAEDRARTRLSLAGCTPDDRARAVASAVEARAIAAGAGLTALVAEADEVLAAVTRQSRSGSRSPPTTKQTPR